MARTAKYSNARITDPVHGTIELSRLEIDLLSTRAFQRLRNVKQLGLAHLVFSRCGLLEILALDWG